MHKKIACIIPTYQAGINLITLFDSLKIQNLHPDIYIIDSSSSDDTCNVSMSFGAQFDSIPKSNFNHGGTRQMLVNRYPEYDIYIFLTQDAYLESDNSLECLVKPFLDEQVGAVCGRQLPHLNATLLAEHARLFNYPSESRTKSKEDASELGIKTPFISNSFAAYRREALLDVGGFPGHVILAEDMYVAARMLLKGWKIAYAGDACCRHSHNYTMLEELRRYFDTGVFHAREPWILGKLGGSGGEGLRYVNSELRFLGLKRLYLWPASLLRNALKLIGYKLGQHETRFPRWVKRRLSMHRSYWDGPFA